jgi:hypothetical protein
MRKPPLAWGKKVSAEFREILYKGCEAMRWGDRAPSYLMACMAFESAETFNPAIKNMAGSSGTGLIQFMDFTAKSLGTTTAALARMTPEEQLKWVFKYFDQFSKLKTPTAKISDIYMGILKPAYIGAPESTKIIITPQEYRPNSGLDTNKDGAISKAEAAQKIEFMLDKGYGEKYCYKE